MVFNCGFFDVTDTSEVSRKKNSQMGENDLDYTDQREDVYNPQKHRGGHQAPNYRDYKGQTPNFREILKPEAEFNRPGRLRRESSHSTQDQMNLEDTVAESIDSKFDEIIRHIDQVTDAGKLEFLADFAKNIGQMENRFKRSGGGRSGESRKEGDIYSGKSVKGMADEQSLFRFGDFEKQVQKQNRALDGSLETKLLESRQSGQTRSNYIRKSDQVAQRNFDFRRKRSEPERRQNIIPKLEGALFSDENNLLSNVQDGNFLDSKIHFIISLKCV